MSSGRTPRLQVPYPADADSADFGVDIAAIATYLDNNMVPYYQGSTFSGTPVVGDVWWCTDNTSAANYGLNYYNGSAWLNVGPYKLYRGSSAPSPLYPGLGWINTSTTSPSLQVYSGSAWVIIVPGTNTNGLSIVSASGGWVLSPSVADSGWIALSTLGYQNGWVNYTALATPVASYRLQANVLRLRGTVTGGSGATIVILPSGYRPTAILNFAAASYNPTGTAIPLDITSAGLVTVGTTGYNVSLDGITFTTD
jgi:hypothetical protein